MSQLGLALLIFLMANVAVSAPPSPEMVYSGRLYNAAGEPVSGQSLTVRLEVNLTGACYLYQRDEIVTTDADGNFQMTLKTGAGELFASGSLQDILSTSTTGALDCYNTSGGGAGTMIPPTADRNVVLSLVTSGVPEVIDTQVLRPYYQANDSILLAGKEASAYLTSGTVSQSSLDSLFTSANFSAITDYATTGKLATSTAPTAGSDVVNKTYSDSKIAGNAIDASVTTPTPGHVLSWDGSKWISSALTSTDNTKLPLAGGTMTGPLVMSGTAGISLTSGTLSTPNIEGTQYLTMNANGYLLLSNNAAPALTAGHEGAMWYHPTSDEVLLRTTAGTVGLISNAPQSQALILASPAGSAGSPTFRSLAATDIPGLSASHITAGIFGVDRGGTGIAPAVGNANQIYAVNAAGNAAEFKQLIAGTNVTLDFSTPGAITIAATAGGGGSVAAVTAGTGLLGGTITGNGTLFVDTGTTSGKIVQVGAGDKIPVSLIPSLSTDLLTSGTLGVALGGTGLAPVVGNANQIYGINNAGTAAEFKGLFAGSGVSITHGVGSLIIAATGAGGSVTNVGLTASTSVFTVTNSPVSGAGTMSLGLASQAANSILAAPTGTAGTPSFRALTSWDLPNLDASKITMGTLPMSLGGTGSGTFDADTLVIANSLGTKLESKACAVGEILVWKVAGGWTCEDQWTRSGSSISYSVGSVGIGTLSPTEMLDVRGADRNVTIAVTNESSTAARQPQVKVTNYSASGIYASEPRLSLVTIRGSSAAPEPVDANDTLGSIEFGGGQNNSASYGTGASIWAAAEEDFSPTEHSSSLIFGTTLGTSFTGKMIIRGDGRVGIGESTPTVALDVAGMGTLASAIRVPRDTTVNRPVGVATTLRGMLRYNTTLDKYEVYEGSTGWASLVTSAGGASQWSNIASGISYTTGSVSIGATSAYDGRLSVLGAFKVGDEADGGGDLFIASRNDGGTAIADFMSRAHSARWQFKSSQGEVAVRIGRHDETQNYLRIYDKAFHESGDFNAPAINLMSNDHSYINSGSLGIGTTTPSALLEVNGRIEATELCDNSGTNCRTIDAGWSPWTEWGTGIRYTAGSVSISNKLYVNDRFHFSGTMAISSTGSVFIRRVNDTSLAIGHANNSWTSSYSTAVGQNALSANISGSGNTAIGSNAGESATTGSNNTLIGYGAGANITSGANNISIGVGAGVVGTGSNNILIGVGGANDTSGQINIGGVFQGSTVANTASIFTNSTARLTVSSAGSVGIGTTTPSERLHVAGVIRADDGFLNPSDIRLKKDIGPISGLESIRKISGYSYRWRKDDRPDAGVIAQEVEKVFPDAVRTDANGFKAVKYDYLIAPLIEATKELDIRCEMQSSQLLERIERLEEENSRLQEDKLKMEERLIRLERAAGLAP